MIRLIIEDKGDVSVGIFPQSWDIETPFYDINPEGMEWFARKMVEVYSEFADGKITYTYTKNNEIISDYDLQD